MNGDEELPEGVPGFDDPAYDDLRALLGDLGDVGPMPDDVVARLDGVLADLGGTKSEDVDPVVVPLRRRSKLGPRLLVAAAAVVVVGAGGVGLAQVIDNSANDSKTVSADSGSSADMPASQPEVADGAATGGGLDSLGKDDSALPALSRADFATDATQVLRRATLFDGSKAPTTQSQTPSDQVPAPTASALTPGRSPSSARDFSNLAETYSYAQRTCTTQLPGALYSLPILLDGEPAILAVYPAAAGSQRIQAYDCAGEKVLASADVPD